MNLRVDLRLKLYCILYIQYTTLPPHVVVLCVKYICCYLLLGTWGIFLASTTSRSGARSQMLLIDAVSLCKYAAAAYKRRAQIKFEMKNSSASSIKANCQCLLYCCVIVVLFYYNKTNVKMSNCLWTQH